jgi:hypothetical protein
MNKCRFPAATLLSLGAWLIWPPLQLCLADSLTPKGTDVSGFLVESHSTEIYAGGCIVSSEEDTFGRYLTRAWRLNAGSHQGVALAGLSVVLVEHHPSANLAKKGVMPQKAFLYLPDSATAAQRAALQAWVETQRLASEFTEVCTVPVSFTAEGKTLTLTAGDRVAVQAQPAPPCENGGCGQQLWYSPRSAGFLDTEILLTAATRVSQPDHQLKWDAGNRRSTFVGRFMDRTDAATVADHCPSSCEVCP